MEVKRRARERMIDAFLEELKTTHYTKVKVSDIIKEADVNRSTFYRNFTDIIDMYEQVCNEYIDLMIEPVRLIKYVDVDSRKAVFEYMKDYYCHISQYIEVFRTIGACADNYAVLYDFRNALYGETTRIADNILEEKNVDIRMLCENVADYFSMLVLCDCVPPVALDEFENRGFSFNVKESFIENAASIMSMMDKSRNKTNVAKAISFILKCWEKHSYHPAKIATGITVSKLMDYLGMTRSLFYTAYESIDDFVSFYYSAFAYVFSEYLITLLSSDINDIPIMFRQESLERSSMKSNPLSNLVNTPVFTKFISSTIKRVLSALSASSNMSDSKESEFCLSFYVVSVVTLFFRYLEDFDSKKFVNEIKIFFEKRDDDGIVFC